MAPNGPGLRGFFAWLLMVSDRASFQEEVPGNSGEPCIALGGLGVLEIEGF